MRGKNEKIIVFFSFSDNYSGLCSGGFNVISVYRKMIQWNGIELLKVDYEVSLHNFSHCSLRYLFRLNIKNRLFERRVKWSIFH